jgi:hypothetical protein
MADNSQDMLAFLGVAPDRRLLEEDLSNLPEAEQHHEPAMSTEGHDRLVRAGSVLTGVTLIGGVALLVYGAVQLLFNGGGAVSAVLAVIGLLFAATHWGWVHVAEYAGLTIDAHRQHELEARELQWLATIEPYPRFSVSTSVLDDASTRVKRTLHRPVLTEQHTFTFIRQTDAETTFDSQTPAEVIATAGETKRREARLETDRLRDLWEAASSAYAAASLSAEDDQEQLAARRAAATALSEHLNASLLEPPLVE